MPADDAYIVTFDHDGRSYNVWLYPTGNDGKPGVNINFRGDDDAIWRPIEMLGGSVRLEFQGSLLDE